MKLIEQFQVRGLPGLVHKVQFGNRTVDYWAPAKPGGHILVAHDGQNVLDKRNIGINPLQRATWELGLSSVRAAQKHGITPPTLMCVYHTNYLVDPLGRVKEYTPKKYMNLAENWMPESYGLYRDKVELFVNELSADVLIQEIKNVIVPSITESIGQEIIPQNVGIVGASMGGLAAIYAAIEEADFFHTSLSFSPHWVIGGDELARKMMRDFPVTGKHKLWMSRGTKGLDSKYENSQDLANALIKERGYREGVDLITRTLNKGAHTNATWARYVPAALDFWLKRGKQ
jgi:predicted alpha/beta superfamily hydrolase